MKENVSFLKLAIRSTFYKFLILTGLVCLVQAVLLAAQTAAGRGFESALNSAVITAAGGVALVAVAILLMLPWVKSGSARPAATLQRLRITNGRAAFWLILYNSLCFLIFWGAQLGLFLLFGKAYLVYIGASGHLHLIALAAWRVAYFHMLLPLGDVLALIRDIIIILSLGFVTVGLVLKSSSFSGAYTAITASAVISAATDGAGDSVLVSLLHIACLALMMICWILFIKGACQNKEEPSEKEQKTKKRKRRSGGSAGKEEQAA